MEHNELTIVILLIFLVFGMLFYINATLKPSLLFLQISRIETYIKDTPSVIKIAEEINETCGIDNFICKYYKAVEFIDENVGYRKDQNLLEEIFFVDDDPEFILEHGNDCDGRTVLLADILKHIGIKKVYILIQWCRSDNENEEVITGHACVLAVVENSFKFYDCGSHCDIEAIKRVV